MPMAPPEFRLRTRPRGAAISDADLVQACLDGDAGAWDELLHRYGRLVYSIPRRYGFSDADADDVFQVVLTILFRKLDTIRDRDRLSAWLIRTTHRECYRIGKKSGRYSELDRDIEDVNEPSDLDAELWERRQLVRQGLRRLGGRCEQLLTALFVVAGQPDYETIARQLDMRVGSIGPTRARCFGKLEKILIELGLAAGDVPGKTRS